MATVLIADDERVLREMLAEVVRDAGHEVVLAINGQQALDLVAQARADLIISDVMMPRVSGADLCRRLKSSPATASIPIILVSAVSSAQGAPADAFLRKPVKLAELEALLRRWLGPGKPKCDA